VELVVELAMEPSLLYLMILGAGFALGLLVSYLANGFQDKTGLEVSSQLVSKSEEAQRESADRVMEAMKASFSSLSSDVLMKSTEELIKRAKDLSVNEREIVGRELEGKKQLIDAQLQNLHQDLNRMNELVRNIEKERGDQIGSLSAQIKSTNDQTAHLIKTTASLSDVLSNSQVRGQWGERIADDVLRVAGFQDGINYSKQQSLTDRSRPDFTFMLPQGLILNMDVKFPISNYAKVVDAKLDVDKDRYKKMFFRDVKARIKEVTTKNYISEADKTVDCVLLFIPNEQIFSFVLAEAPEIFDEAVKNKVICCSPLTLFAVLAVIRQSVDNFSLEQTSGEILKHMSSFKKQWAKYLEKFGLLGKKLREAQAEYENLASTRTRLLDLSIDRLDKLRERGSSDIEEAAESRDDSELLSIMAQVEPERPDA
jgi:DNA recombination protein RmuC